MYKLMFNDNASKVMTDDISDMIRKYTLDGYKIDCKESAVDPDSDVDKDCTFKAVLKKDVDGIECKTIIRLLEDKTAIGKSTTLSKVEYVGDTQWSAESHSYSHSYTYPAKDYDSDTSAWDKYIYSTMGNTRLSDIIKTPNKDDDNSTKKWRSALDLPPSAFQRLDDYIKLNDEGNDNHIEGDGTVHIKVNKDDSVDDVYKKITDKRKDGLKEASDAKLLSDLKNLKPDDGDEIEDSLITLIKFLFGK